LKAGLSLFEHGEVESAAWFWLFWFRSHWGRHAASAIFALEARES